MPPAWMAELSEEWIEPVEEDELVHSRSASPQLDFGSLVINDIPLPSPSQASIDGHPDEIDNKADQQQEKSYQMGSILFSPSKKKTRSNAHMMDDDPSSTSINYAPSPDQQLAMAAKAFNVDLLNQADDDDEQDENSFVVKSLPQAKLSMKPVRTPAKLQSLFMQPSPPPLSDTRQQQHTEVTNPRLAEDKGVQEEVQELEQDLSKAIQHRDDEQPERSASLSLPSEPSSEQQEEGTQASFLIHQDLDEIPEPSLAEGEEEGSIVQHDERNARHSDAQLDNQARELNVV